MRLGGVTRAVVAGLAVAILAAGCATDADGARDADDTAVVAGAKVGKVLDVRVHRKEFATRCAGDEGEPSVMLVAGEGTDMVGAWDPVQSQIGRFARVCAYDRLGVGGSDAPPRSQTLDDMADDLDGVLRDLEMERPVVLVAHSIGGFVAASFAQQNREDVAGLLLLDAAGPGFPQRVLRRLPRRDSAPGAAVRNGWQLLLDPADNEERLDGRSSFAAAEAYAPLGDVPIVALTHSISDFGEDDIRPRQAADLESAWEAGQNRWLSLSSQARLERVDLAGHDIARDQPEVVVERVRELVGG